MYYNWITARWVAETISEAFLGNSAKSPDPHTGIYQTEAESHALLSADISTFIPKIDGAERSRGLSGSLCAGSSAQCTVGGFKDEQFGRLLNLLDELNASENTLVLFVSDHGDLIGAHRLFDKGPMMYEEQLHIPLVVRWPGTVPSGQNCDAMVTLV